MRKRERENACGVCGHYHKAEEVCGTCGHRVPVETDKSSAFHVSAFPSEILSEFLYLGSYDNASRVELLKSQGISHILNTVPTCPNLYKNSFTYHLLKEDQVLSFDDAAQFLAKCENDKVRVLVHCMSGKSRSPAIVIAYLMRTKGWRLAQSYQWVKEKRPSVELTPAVNQQLEEYEQKIFGSAENPTGSFTPFSFGITKKNEEVNPVPGFSSLTTEAIFEPSGFNVQEFAFGAREQ